MVTLPAMPAAFILHAHVPMTRKAYSPKECFLAVALFAVSAICACTKPTASTSAQPTPAAAASPTPALSGTQDLSTAAVHILNKANRAGGVMLRGVCGPNGIADQYKLPASATLEPMDKALQEVSAQYQNIYWRESPATGVRIADSQAKGKLLAVRVREFRIVEDREPDRVMQMLWRTPEVAAFLRRNHIRFARRADGERKVLSPPMIVEMKNRTVADILDRIAAGYHSSQPRVWIYQECGEQNTATKNQYKEARVDVQIR